MISALFAGKWVPILSSTLKKPKENQGFWLQPLKNLRKINVFGPWGPMGPPGAPWGHNVAPGGLPGLPNGPHGAQWGQWALAPWGPRAPRGYIDKLPINRPNGGVLVQLAEQVTRMPRLMQKEGGSEKPSFPRGPIGPHRAT